jgi:hypothetical protein
MGPEHRDTLVAELGLADSLSRQQRFEEAEPLFKEVMRVSEKQAGSAELFVDGMRLLARNYVDQGRVDEGRVLFERVIQEGTLRLGEDSLITQNAVEDAVEEYRSRLGNRN